MNKVDKYFETFTSRNTVHSYKAILEHFFHHVYGPGSLDAQVEQYIHDQRDPEEDIKQFFIAISHFTPVSIRQYLNVTKNFVEYLTGKEFPRRFIKDLLRRRKGTRPVTDDRAPTVEELRSILSHLNLKGKAVVLCMVSSGMRVGEVIQLNIEDVNLEKSPVEVSIRAGKTKTGNRRTTFLSQETKEHVLQWLRVRDNYKEFSQKRHFSKLNAVEDRRLFPFSVSVVRSLWNLGLKKTGLDDQDSITKYRKIRIHSLRKFFKTQLTKVEGAGEMPEGLLGHIDTYLRYSPEEYREFYSRAEYAVSVFGGTDLKELSETKKTVTDLRDFMDKDHFQLLILLEENKRLKDMVESLAEKFGSLEALQSRITELEDYVEIGVLKKEAERIKTV